MLSGEIYIAYENIFEVKRGLTNVLSLSIRTNMLRSMFFIDKMTELVAATVPNVDLGKGSEEERETERGERKGRSGEWPRAGKTKQRAEQTT